MERTYQVVSADGHLEVSPDRWIGHIAAEHRELVEHRQWVTESQYAQLLGLCQFLPGPASSQLGFALVCCVRAGVGPLPLSWCAPQISNLIVYKDIIAIESHRCP